MTRDPAPTLRSFDDSLPMALMRAREAVMRHFRPILTEHDVTEQQWRVLRALHDADGPLSVGELAERTYLLGPSLSRMLVALENRSLILRGPAVDARRSEIVIAPAGRAVVAAVAPQSEAAYTTIGEHLDPGELGQLYDLLAKVTTTRGKIDESQPMTVNR
ncbi:MAG: homoprotocatechuate degradation operon regulator HpaR [Ilumatobacteraceae bacterium]